MNNCFERLPEELKESVMAGFWSGCGMHKNLDSLKAGAERMLKWWGETGKTAPIALINKARARAGQDAKVRRTDRGAIKLTDLLGALVKHKDPKKGHQDLFRVFSKEYLKGQEAVLFPDTSNTRYQSHTSAAVGYCLRPPRSYVTRIFYPAYLLFLAVSKGTLTHMETNILCGLHDKPIITKVIVLTLYGEAISTLFAGFLCASKGKNGLNFGPDYDHLKKHLENLIDHPTLLIRPNIDATVVSFDSQPWKNAEIIHQIERIHRDYPDLEGALVVFLRGALDKLEKFTEEFKQGFPISKATPEECWLAFRQPTNDLNEGALGLLHQMYRQLSNIEFGQLNNRLMCT